MSNLSELLPTGGGQNAVDFVASGTLSSGQTVVLKTDGTVEAVSETAVSEELGSAVVFEAASTQLISSAYDSSSGKTLITYVDSGNSNYGTSVVATVSGTSISFGTPVVFESASSGDTASAFDPVNNKVVIAYKNGQSPYYGKAIVATISGTSVSFGSSATTNANTTYYSGIAYDSINNKFVVAYSDGGNGQAGTARVGTVSGTSISFGTAVVFNSTRSDYLPTVFDSANGKVVIAYRDVGASLYGEAVVGTVSGTSISFGTPVVFESARSDYISLAYDSSSNKVVAFYADGGDSYYGKGIVGTVSGSSISFGTPTTFENADTRYTAASFDSNANKTVVLYQDYGNSSYGTYAVGTVSGTSISFATPVVYNAATTRYSGINFDSTTNTMVIGYENQGNSSYGTGVVLRNASTATNSADFIGITAEAISDTATGPVNVYGGINTTAKGPITTAVGTRSTFNSTSYTSYPDMVYDEANQKVIVVYRQETGTSYPMGVVGTVSGTSLSWGTPVVLRSTSTKTGGGPRVVYDPNTEKVLVSCLPSNVAQGQIVVCTVSGTSISPGSVNVWDTGILEYQSMAYDTANARVVIAYKYNTAPATDDGYAVVGTVSGDSISFGSRVLFDSGSMSYPSTAYDSNTGKIVIAYNSGGPKAIVGTVSGTSISFGSITTITMTTPNMTYSDLVYDAGNQKVVFVTRKSAVPTSGLALVGTVSGTSISFGTEVAFTTDGINYMAATYDSTLGKVAICYEESATDDGKMVLGTVSGTSISFTSPVTFESTTSLDYVTAATYDPNEQVVVAGYTDDGVPVYGRATAISVTAPLTIGSDYYVQNDGSLSTTASSVKAGQAISATTINMMDLT